jgi:hypothetical protein
MSGSQSAPTWKRTGLSFEDSGKSARYEHAENMQTGEMVCWKSSQVVKNEREVF